jgi:quercetin dioxygenase-like cupin family protein
MKWLNRVNNNFDASKKSTFSHDLQNHPLMQFSELKKLALRHPTVKYHSANIPRTQSLETVVQEAPSNMNLADALNNIESSGTFVFIQNIQNDPIYGKFVNEILDEIEKDVHKNQSNMRKRQAWVFITSPGGTTPYHRDQESAHYFHIKGKKTFWLWDPTDRSVVSQKENEFFHGVYGLSKTRYDETYMSKASEYTINPGDGIFFPYTAPHMVENGKEEFSISFSVTHMTDEDFAIRRVNKINQLLRKFGVSPKDQGESGLIDNLKLALHWVLRTTLSPFGNNWKNA